MTSSETAWSPCGRLCVGCGDVVSGNDGAGVHVWSGDACAESRGGRAREDESRVRERGNAGFWGVWEREFWSYGDRESCGAVTGRGDACEGGAGSLSKMGTDGHETGGDLGRQTWICAREGGLWGSHGLGGSHRDGSRDVRFVAGDAPFDGRVGRRLTVVAEEGVYEGDLGETLRHRLRDDGRAGASRGDCDGETTCHDEEGVAVGVDCPTTGGHE